jgi:hypothetical protein
VPHRPCLRCGVLIRSGELLRHRAEFSQDRSRKDGRAPWCKACVRSWQQENAEHLADYHHRWQQANPEKKRAQDRRYRERKRQDPDYWERRRARDRLYRARKRARLSDTPPETNDG